MAGLTASDHDETIEAHLQVGKRKRPIAPLSSDDEEGRDDRPDEDQDVISHIPVTDRSGHRQSKHKRPRVPTAARAELEVCSCTMVIFNSL